MSTPKRTAAQEQAGIEDALIQSIMDAAGSELRQEISTAGGDPEKCIAEIDVVVSAAKSACAKQRLEKAKTELAAFRSTDRKASNPELASARARLERMKSGHKSPDDEMMMAARKGEGFSERDLEGLIDDIAEVERLERGDEEA